MERSGRSRAMKEGNEQDVAAGMVWNGGQEAEVNTGEGDADTELGIREMLMAET